MKKLVTLCMAMFLGACTNMQQPVSKAPTPVAQASVQIGATKAFDGEYVVHSELVHGGARCAYGYDIDTPIVIENGLAKYVYSLRNGVVLNGHVTETGDLVLTGAAGNAPIEVNGKISDSKFTGEAKGSGTYSGDCIYSMKSV